MTKIKMLIAAFAVIALTGCTITKEAEEKVKTISVSGSGSVQVNPDQLSLTFQVKTREWNVNDAVTKNAQISEKVIETVKETGIDSKDIATYDYRITQETDVVNGREYPGRYTVLNSIRILVRNTENAGAVIDGAVRSGANGLTGFEYLVGDTSAALRQARTLAVQNAQDAAALLAGASGTKVADVLEISEGNSYTSRNSNNMLMKAQTVFADSSAITPIETGTVTVTASVNITYSLQ